MKRPLPRSGRSRVRLADHVRACCIDNQIIFLDLRRGRYLAVASQPSLASAIGGWPVGSVDQSTTPTTASGRLFADLVSQGLLTDRPEATGLHRPHLTAPDHSLDGDEADASPALDWRRVGRLCRIGAAASWRLRWQSLEGIAESVTARRAKLPGGGAGVLDATRAAIAAYARIRVFAFSTHDRCLHDSLTLTGYLAAEGIASHWVIGVRTRPFAAHSWTQIGNAVVNDHHEQVRRFVPILVA